MRRTVPWKKNYSQDRELTVKNISQFYLCDLCDICNFLITLKDNKWKRVYQKKSSHTRSTNFRKKKFYFINDNYYNDVRQIVVIFLSPNSFLLLEAKKGCLLSGLIVHSGFNMLDFFIFMVDFFEYRPLMYVIYFK